VLVGHDSSVGIATRQGLGGPGNESRCGRDFPHHFRPALGNTQLPIQWVKGLFAGGAAAGGVALTNHPHVAPRFKKE
jgi:hypothetical protein